MTHKEWVDNEYAQWIAALNECTVHNFKEHPMVKRMLGEPDMSLWIFLMDGIDVTLLATIDDIGREEKGLLSFRLLRYIHYAQQLLARNPSAIFEIGGGVGQFYAILRALGYKGTYYIYDLPEVKKFQYKYLEEVTKQTGLNTEQVNEKYDGMYVSFYALGEFSDEMKLMYAHLFRNTDCTGYIVWNPHSGATDDLSIFPKHINVTPGIEPGIKIIEW